LPTIRAAHPDDLDRLAQIWHDGWRDGHLAIVPDALARVRTLENFRERLQAALTDVRVVIVDGTIVGFSMLKGDELYQFYVAAEARGSGIAATLIDDAEAALAWRGVTLAWLACAVGNDRAARFYEKRGWQRVATVIYESETSVGLFPVETWRYEKALKR
jgi:ribosomal protein S18 acetylase RimI-like enzyme